MRQTIESESPIKRFSSHLRRGTLRESVREHWRDEIKKWRTRWWQRQVGHREFVFFNLQRDLRMMLPLDSRLAKAIYCGYFEEGERQFIWRYLRRGDVFVDVGANIGMFTLIASRKVSEEGKVYAFEPSPRTYLRLTQNVALNDLRNVTCLQMGLSHHSGHLDMNVSLDGYDAWDSFAVPTAGNSFKQELVSTLRWDDFVDEHNLAGRVAFMKIDVEGWESRVLGGGQAFFGRLDAPVLQIEFTEEAAQASGTSCPGLYRQLETFGYRMFTYEMKTNRLIPEPLRNHYPYLNLFAVKRQEEALSRLSLYKETHRR